MKIGEKIKIFRESRKISVKDFSKSIGISANYLSEIEHGKKKPSLPVIMLIELRYATYLGDGLYEERMPSTRDISLQSGLVPKDIDLSAFSYVPRYSGVHVTAGHGGNVVHENVTDYVAFQTSWLKTSIMVNPSEVFCVYVEGDSMEPTLRPGDMVLAQKTSEFHGKDGIYILRINGTIFVKRIHQEASGKILIISDNHAYPTDELQDSDRIGFIGRVVWLGRRIL
jgi:phage repressor protein C with HTH and peptisase S24 domain